MKRKLCLAISATFILLTVFIVRSLRVNAPIVESESPGFSSSHLVADRLVIPDLHIDVRVKESKIVNGYWEVFDTQAGWGEQSGYLGEKGNQVIFAHARRGLFLNLNKAQKGMVVSLYSNGKLFSYKVENFTQVAPSDISVVAPTPDETLTLYTCSGLKDSNRMVVVAKRV